MKYEAAYIANDGKRCKFHFESDHVLRHHNTSKNHFMATPILEDLIAKRIEIQANPDSHMNQHGGIKHSLYVKNESTGEIIISDYIPM